MSDALPFKANLAALGAVDAAWLIVLKNTPALHTSAGLAVVDVHHIVLAAGRLRFVPLTLKIF